MQNNLSNPVIRLRMSVSENTEGDSDHESEFLDLRIGALEMEHLDRMAVAARLCGGDVSVNSFPVFDDCEDEQEATIIVDQFGRLSLSSFKRVRHAWPVEVSSDSLIRFSTLKGIYQSAQEPMMALMPYMNDNVYVESVASFEETVASDDMQDLMSEVMSSDDEDRVATFEALYQGGTGHRIEQDLSDTAEQATGIFIVSGREFGAEDDSVMLVEAASDAEAESKFEALLKDELGESFEAPEGNPAVFLNSTAELAAALRDRIA
jgi:hypothetical protein